MNLADMSPMPTVIRSMPAAGGGSSPTLEEVVARIAAEVAGPLTAALARVQALSDSGRIDKPGLLALRHEIDSARRVGLQGQQIARFASGEVRPQPERIDLAAVLRDVLEDQDRRSPASALGGRLKMAPAEVMGDASLVHAALRAAAEWSAAHARAGVDWLLEMRPWPVHARLSCRFAHVAADRVGDAASAASDDEASAAATSQPLGALDSLDWLLLRYTAHIAGISLHRSDSASHSSLVLAFQRTINVTLEGASAVDLSASGGAESGIAGSQVLVLASGRDVRRQLREALQGQDLLVDYVSTTSAAAQYCEDGAPQILLYEASFEGDAMWALRRRLAKLVTGVVMIEILPSGLLCEMGDGAVDSVTRLGADGLRQTLGSVMTLEMARRRKN